MWSLSLSAGTYFWAGFLNVLNSVKLTKKKQNKKNNNKKHAHKQKQKQKDGCYWAGTGGVLSWNQQRELIGLG